MAIRAHRVVHVNVNCSDLDAALAFWSGRLGLTPTFRTTPGPQDCSAFGLGEEQRDAWLLADRLDMGPGLPPLRALFFPGPDGEMLELIEPSA